MKQRSINNVFYCINYMVGLTKPLLLSISFTMAFLIIIMLILGIFTPILPVILIHSIMYTMTISFFIASFYVSVLYMRSLKIYDRLSVVTYWAINGYAILDKEIIKSLNNTNTIKNVYAAGYRRLTKPEINEIMQYGLDNLHGPFVLAEKITNDFASSNNKIFIFKEKCDYITMKIKFAS